jgi:hypothetical protein
VFLSKLFETTHYQRLIGFGIILILKHRASHTFFNAYFSLPSAGKWLVDSLNNGSFAGDSYGDDDVSWGGWINEAKCSDLYASYLIWCDKLKVGQYDRDSQIIFSKYLGEIYKKKQIGRERVSGFVLGTLKEATVQFQKFEKIKLSTLK